MAGRIRSLKPELRENAAVACLSDAAARLYLLLPTLADDEGRLPAGASFLAGAIFFGKPRAPAQVGRLLVEIEAAGLVRRYEMNAAPFLEIVGWSSKGGPMYQLIRHPHPFRYPAPIDVPGTNVRTEIRTESGPPNTNTNTNTNTKIPPARAHAIPRSTEQSPPPTEPETRTPEISRAPEPRIKINHDAWTHASDEHRRLRAGIDRSAIPWPAMPCGDAYGELGKRTLELLAMDPSFDNARVVHRRRVAVAVAEAKREGHLRWFTPWQFYDAERFWRAAELSPEQASAPRRGPRASEPVANLRMRDRGDDMPPIDPEGIPERLRGGRS